MAPNIRDSEVGEAGKLHGSKIECDKRSVAELLEELARQLMAEAGPNAREVSKEDIDELWGQ